MVSCPCAPTQLGQMMVNLRPAFIAQQNPVSEKEKDLDEAH